MLRQRMSRLAAAVVAALFSITAFACGTSGVLRKDKSKVKLEIEQTATPQQAVFTGVVQFQGKPLPGATVVVRDEATKRETTAITDAKGVFTIPRSWSTCC